MNTGKQQTYTAVSVVIDAIVLTVSYVISYLIQFALQNNLAPFDSRNYWPPLVIIVISYLMLYAFFHIYGSFRMTGRRKEAVLIGKVNIIGALILFAVFFVISNDVYGLFRVSCSHNPDINYIPILSFKKPLTLHICSLII